MTAPNSKDPKQSSYAKYLRRYVEPQDEPAEPAEPAAGARAMPWDDIPMVLPFPSGDRPLNSDLEMVLSAWHTATERLQKTHEVLCNEVGRLSDELEAKNRELVRKNRLADLGQMASHVAHEVRNALAPVTLYLSLLRRSLKDDAAGLRILDKLESGFTSLEATVHDMLSFTSDRRPSWRRFALRDLVSDVCESLSPQLNAHGLSVSWQVAADLAVWGDPDMLRRALVNLTLNAIDAMPRGGEICFSAAGLDEAIEIEVADSGPGIPEDLAPRIFEPFFTTKSDGAGLGLAIVYRVAEAHGGEVRAANCPEGGAAFTIRIPKTQRREAA
jgi:signal transduction histidine kinase